MASNVYRARVSFTVPVTAATYAPEVIQFGSNTTNCLQDGLLGLTAIIESNAATGAVLELWLLKIGGTPGTSGDYYLSSNTLGAGSATWPLASYPGIQLRAKSAGVAGALVVNASAD